MTHSELVAHISTTPFQFENRDELLDAVDNALFDGGFVFHRDCLLVDCGRIDFYVSSGRVGIAVRTAGMSNEVLDHMWRYAAHPKVESLILITPRWSHTLPDKLAGKTVSVVKI